MSFQTILAIGFGGFLGAVTRAYLNGVANRNIPHDLPFGTLSVNIIGSFAIGVFFAYAQGNESISPVVKSFISTGFLGALTTFSTFSYETFFLINSGNMILAFSNASLNLFGTIVATGMGFKLVKIFHLA
jgi:CrcB protein